MSNKGSSNGRFDGQLSRLKAGAEAKTVKTPAREDGPTPAAEREKFTSYLKPGMKSKLKQAVAKDGRKQYEVLDEMLEEWFLKHYPDIYNQ